MAPFGIDRNHTYDDFVADLDLILDTFDTESGSQLRDVHEAPVAKELDEGAVRFNAEAPTKRLGADIRQGTVARRWWGDPDWNRRCGGSAPTEPEPGATKGFGVREDRALDRLRIGVRHIDVNVEVILGWFVVPHRWRTIYGKHVRNRTKHAVTRNAGVARRWWRDR